MFIVLTKESSLKRGKVAKKHGKIEIPVIRPLWKNTNHSFFAYRLWWLISNQSPKAICRKKIEYIKLVFLRSRRHKWTNETAECHRFLKKTDFKGTVQRDERGVATRLFVDSGASLSIVPHKRTCPTNRPEWMSKTESFGEKTVNFGNRTFTFNFFLATITKPKMGMDFLSHWSLAPRKSRSCMWQQAGPSTGTFFPPLLLMPCMHLQMAPTAGTGSFIAGLWHPGLNYQIHRYPALGKHDALPE